MIPEQIYRQALRYLEDGHVSDARRLAAKLAARHPKHDGVLDLRARIAASRGDYAEAGKLWQSLLLRSPGDIGILSNIGAAMQRENRLREAETYFVRALSLAPEEAGIYYNLGVICQHAGRDAEAESRFRQALALAPGLISALNNLGALHERRGDVEGAEAFYRQAVILAPDVLQSEHNLALILEKRGQLGEAEALYRKVLARQPDFLPSQLNLGMLLLLQGRFAEGWPLYEARLIDQQVSSARNKNARRWSGVAFAQQHLVISCEQGAGDSLMFVRFLSRVVSLGGSLSLVCPPPLMQLFGELPGVRVVAEDEPIAQHVDYSLSLMSLANVFKVDVDAIPATCPYLHVPSKSRRKAQPIIEALERDKRPKIGIAWAGNPAQENDRYRSMPFERIGPLLANDEVCWVILQRDSRPEGFDLLARNAGWLDCFSAEFLNVNADYGDTAAVIQALDLVITVDTSIAHLAGALGKNTWTMLWSVPDWRWLLGRDDSPWYPSMRLYRQTCLDDWNRVVSTISDDLRAWSLAR